MRRKLIGLAMALAVTVGVSLSTAGPAQAAPAIQITKVYYNSPGTDNRSNSSLNAEYVKLTNRRSTAVNLKNWTLRDKSNHVYKFSGNVRLAARASVYVHTGKGSNTSTHRYWGSGAYIWNNTGDKAYLRNSGGTLIDSCSWGRKGSYTNC